ncbi:MAG TPA: phosphatidate cytidylyltransferase [Thermoanaerobaculia bacterium]|nr:phosphatidate cytidylyltransferase [Thermoanaerobaculia bacterium]
MKRVLTALTAGSLAIAAIVLLESFWLFWVALALLQGCAIEYLRLGRRVHAELPRAIFLLVLPAVALLWLAAAPSPAVLPLAALAGSPLLFAVALLARGGTPASAVGALGWLSFGLPYLVLPVWALYELHRQSRWVLLGLLVAVWANDSVAFWVGSTWGRRKLAPRLSPNKTWEGALGGLVGGSLIGLAALWWMIGRQPSWTLGAILVVSIVAAQLGDLVESMLKRAAAVKDSGALFPGHGGLLDRLDAIILAVPVFYGLFGATGLAAEL